MSKHQVLECPLMGLLPFYIQQSIQMSLDLTHRGFCLQKLAEVENKQQNFLKGISVFSQCKWQSQAQCAQAVGDGGWVGEIMARQKHGIKKATALLIADVSRHWHKHWMCILNHSTCFLGDYSFRVDPGV